MRISSVIGAFCLTLLVILPTLAVGAAGVDELSVSPTFSYFTWKENGSAGERLVKESGPLYGVAGGLKSTLFRGASGESLTLMGRGDLYGGVVQYDGHTQPGFGYLPVSTDVDYFGLRLGSDACFGLPVGGSTLGPFAGLDYRFWQRSLNATTTLDAQRQTVQVGGTTEYWQEISTRLGIRWDNIPLAREWRLFAGGGAQYPLYTSNTFDTAEDGAVTVEPKGEWSPFAEAGLRYRRLRVAVTYEEQRFGRSSAVSKTNFIYSQPASTSEYLGFSVGYCFR